MFYTHLYCCLISRSKGCVVNANDFDTIVVVGGGGADAAAVVE